MKGIPASEGIGVAQVLVLEAQDLIIETHRVEDTEAEVARLRAALADVEIQLENLRIETAKHVGEKEAEVFEAHKMFLQDPEWVGQIENLIFKEKRTATEATDQVTKGFLQLFEAIEDAYLRERAADLKDVSQRLLRMLLNLREMDLKNLEKPVILVAKDLQPSQTASLDKNRVIGFVTEMGNTTSHTAIIARTLGIPAVVGLSGILKMVKMEDVLAIDGSTGDVVIAPDSAVLADFENRRKAYMSQQGVFESVRGLKSLTADGQEVEVAGNIGKPKDVSLIVNNDGDGIGLFRSEFVFMDRETAPTEEEQFEAYKHVLETLQGKPVIIRTLDAGGDKHIPYLNIDDEMNPFLGYRAIRICLDDQELFKTQLRAIFRASVFGKAKIMFPMIARVEEVRRAKEVVEGVKALLRAEGIPFDESVPIGIMIEVPSAAVMADVLIDEVDFFSIGTNDLTQYTLAADRMNEKLGELYSTFDPAVIRLIANVIQAGNRAGKMVGMCGEAASDPKLIPLWLGLGMDEFSVSPSKILEARYYISKLTKSQLEPVVAKVLSSKSKAEVKEVLEALYKEAYNG